MGNATIVTFTNLDGTQLPVPVLPGNVFDIGALDELERAAFLLRAGQAHVARCAVAAANGDLDELTLRLRGVDDCVSVSRALPGQAPQVLIGPNA